MWLLIYSVSLFNSRLNSWADNSSVSISISSMTTSSRNSNSTCDCHDFIANSHSLAHTRAKTTHSLTHSHIQTYTHSGALTYAQHVSTHTECECALVNAFYKLFYASHKYALYTLRISLPSLSLSSHSFLYSLPLSLPPFSVFLAHNANNDP